MRVLATISILVLLFFLDAWTTSYLAANVDGQELNPFIDTTNFTSILLSPINFLVISLFLFCLFYAEKKKENLSTLLRTQSLRLTAFLFPIYFLIIKLFAVINNLFPIVGYSTPIHYLRMPFSGITEIPFMQLVLVNTILGVLLTPLLILIAKILYGEKQKHEEHTDSSTTDAGDVEH